MKRVLLGTATIISALGTAPVFAADDDRFSLTPYIWLPTVGGQLKYEIPPGSGGSPNVESGPDSYLENLDFALMLTGQMRMGRWSVFGDLIYLDFAGSSSKTKSVNLPGGGSVPVIDAGTETALRGALVTLTPGYSLYETSKAVLDVFGGFRFLPLTARAEWHISGPVDAFPADGSIEQDVDIWSGIIGLRGRARLGESKWSVPYYFDVGTGSSTSTWQAMAAASYGFSWGDVSLAYRHLEYDLDDDKLLQDLSFSGPALGATFRF